MSGEDTIKRALRVTMREQDPLIRKNNFKEVPIGYSEQEAIQEAKRCLQCKKPRCVAGCPVNVQIPQFIALIAEEKFGQAASKILETNALPAICGRVCPQEEQCECKCIMAKNGDPVAIGNLERFAADWQRVNSTNKVGISQKSKNGKKIAIIGSGPAGLTCAGELIRDGFDVTIFEALHEAGGVLVYGIPEFRLPKEIVAAEISYLQNLGVTIQKNFVVGKTATIDELLNEDGFSAVFIGSGAGLPLFLNIKGESSVGVYSANEYLTRSNLMKAYQDQSATPILRGKKVVTVGGGNVAMDAARTALRLGAQTSSIIYRRGELEMPARKSEIHHAKEEGIEFNFLCNPLEIHSDPQGFVQRMVCNRMALGDPDETGRRTPHIVEGDDFEISCDVVIVAIGNCPNPLIPLSTPELNVSRRGTIEVGGDSGHTSKSNVYAGGDIVTGAATVILAMGAGKRAARSISQDLLNGEKAVITGV